MPLGSDTALHDSVCVVLQDTNWLPVGVSPLGAGGGVLSTGIGVQVGVNVGGATVMGLGVIDGVTVGVRVGVRVNVGMTVVVRVAVALGVGVRSMLIVSVLNWYPTAVLTSSS